MAVKRVRAANSKPNYSDSLGMPPKAYGGGAWDADTGLETDSERVQRIVQPGPGSAGKRTVANASKSGFNLRGVVEVLAEHGLDPVAELSKTLMATKPVTDNQGVPLLNKDGTPMVVSVLPLDVRTKALASLIEYVHPKLKSVEMTVKKAELTDDQVEQRLAVLLAAATKAAAGNG